MIGACYSPVNGDDESTRVNCGTGLHFFDQDYENSGKLIIFEILSKCFYACKPCFLPPHPYNNSHLIN